MGNSSSSSSRHHEETVDYGALVPQGVYTGTQDWNQSVVAQLIVSRRLAPFYRPLEEYEESWDDEQILAARKELPSSGENNNETSGRPEPSRSSQTKRPSAGKEFRPEVAVYRGAVECPICFLYYPSNINHSRCCDQAICTECFVQIKRAEPTTTHIVSEPAACPYCVQDNFGIVYNPPPWRAGIGSDGAPPLSLADVSRVQAEASVPTHKRRQKSYSADSPEVVTIDLIRPDWEAKLAAVRAAVARRANRRIIMRQVGDRLIPVGIGRIQTPEEAAAETANGGSRRRRHQPNANGEQYVGVSGQDLEELMLMEAMRLSLIDHEEHQRKEADERRKKEEAERAAGGQGGSSLGEGGSSASPQPAVSSSLPVNTSSLAPGHGSDTTSRSRTPPAPEPSSSWISRSPPPFSTLNAALLSSGTASAFLNSSRPPIVSSTEPVPVPDSSVQTGLGAIASSANSNTSSMPGELPLPSSSTSSVLSHPHSAHGLPSSEQGHEHLDAAGAPRSTSVKVGSTKDLPTQSDASTASQAASSTQDP